MIFLDTSLLVRRFVDDEGIDPSAALASPGMPLLVSAIARVEFRSAMSRRRRSGRLDEPGFRRILAAFEEDMADADVVPVDEVVLARAAALVERRPLRSLDAIQLASAQVAAERSPEPLRFGSADARLNAAAKAEGLALLLEE